MRRSSPPPMRRTPRPALASQRDHRHVGHLELPEGVEVARVPGAKHHPDAAAVTHDQRGQLARAVDLRQSLGDPLLLLEQRLAAGEPKARTGTLPGRESLRVLTLDVDEQPPLPFAAIALTQAGVQARRQPHPSPDDLRCDTRPAQVRRPQRGDRLTLSYSLRQLTSLAATEVVERGIGEPLGANRLDIVVGLAVASQQHPLEAHALSGNAPRGTSVIY